MRAFWEYNISFKDPASVYAYHMFSTHHGIMWYIIIILILVYWCLYKILQDFTRSISSFSGFSLIYYFSTVEMPFFKKIYNDVLVGWQLLSAWYYLFMFDNIRLLFVFYVWCRNIDANPVHFCSVIRMF